MTDPGAGAGPAGTRPAGAGAGGARTDGRILDAAIAEASVVGLDGLTMVGVARRGGMTTGALYPRYEDLTELQVRLWQDRAAPALVAFLDGAVAEARTGPLAATAAAVAAIDPVLMLALEHLVVADRDPALREVAEATVVGWLEGSGGDRRLDDPTSTMLAFTAALCVGAAATGLVGAVARVDWSDALARFVRAGLAGAVPAPQGPPPAPADIPLVVDWTGDEVRDAFLRSALEVIAEVGYHRTTVARLARRTPYSTQAVYLRYPTKADLFVDVVHRAVFPTMGAIGEANQAAFEGQDPVSALAAVALRHTSAQWREWRRLRVETQLAARHVEPLAAAFRLESERSARDWSSATRARLDAAPRLLETLPWCTRALSVGVYLLLPFVPALATCDWRVATTSTLLGLSTFTTEDPAAA